MGEHLTTEELDELIETLGLNKEAFYKQSTKNQQILINLYTMEFQLQQMTRERAKTGWNVADTRQGLKIARKLRRDAEEHFKQSPKSKIADDLRNLKEYAIQEVEYLEDVHKEAIVQQANAPPENTFGDLIGDLFDSVSTMILWGAGIFVLVVVLGVIFGPTHLLPMAGNCRANEGFMDCYWQIQAEKEHLNRFTECQQECGQGLGNQICLEQCEYTYQMGKWKYARTYTTSTGKSFTCPQGQEGYEDAQGRGYCQ